MRCPLSRVVLKNMPALQAHLRSTDARVRVSALGVATPPSKDAVCVSILK